MGVSRIDATERQLDNMWRTAVIGIRYITLGFAPSFPRDFRRELFFPTRKEIIRKRSRPGIDFLEMSIGEQNEGVGEMLFVLSCLRDGAVDHRHGRRREMTADGGLVVYSISNGTCSAGDTS